MEMITMNSLEDKLNAWIENEIKDRSTTLMQYLRQIQLDDTFRWGKMIKSYLQVPSDSLRRKKGLLITGPSGCGKHTAAYHATVFLNDKWKDSFSTVEYPFECAFVSGKDFSFPHEQKDLVNTYLNGLLHSYAGQNLCLVLEYPERSTHCEELLERLGQISCKYYCASSVSEEVVGYVGYDGYDGYDYYDDDETSESGFSNDSVEQLAPLFLIVITEDEKIIPSVLRERLNLCKMTLPNYDRRFAYFLNNGNFEENLMGYNSEQVKALCQKLAKETEGHTYQQLRDSVEELIMQIYGDLEVTELGMSQTCANLQNVDENVVANRVKQRFYEKIIEFVDHIPEILGKIATAAPVSIVAQENVNNPKDDSVSETVEEPVNTFVDTTNKSDEEIWDELNKKSTRELARMLWSEEKIQAMVMTIRSKKSNDVSENNGENIE